MVHPNRILITLPAQLVQSTIAILWHGAKHLAYEEEPFVWEKTELRTRRIRWMLVGSVLFAFCRGMFPASASGQSYYQHEANCVANINARSDALQRHQWELLASSARWYLTYCRDQFRDDEEVAALSDAGIALYEQGSFEDAIPILARCASIKPDAADCFVTLGRSYEALGKIEDARKAYQQAISIGGSDEVNTSAIGLARRALEGLPSEGQPPKPESSSGSEPAAPVESKRFGTGFFVSATGQILTNNHVVEGCKTLTTRDGKLLRVLNQNAVSDLALLQQDNNAETPGLESPNWASAEKLSPASGTDILLRTLRRSKLTDDQRQLIWDAYHTPGNKDTFIRALNRLTLTDDTKQSLWDMRYRSFKGVAVLTWAFETPEAVFRTGPAPELGDSVVAFGFPFPDILSSEGNVSAGIISAITGVGNDVRFIQISAPVQPGNSGGPLFDSSGHVIGIVVAKLDTLKIAQATGDIPQNVNFAVRWSVVQTFLDGAGVPYQKKVSEHATSTRSIAATATDITVEIECTQ